MLGVILTILVAVCAYFMFRSDVKNGRTYSLTVIGKVPNPQFDRLWYWVLGYGEDYPVIVGSSTVYKYLDGERCGTMLDSECHDITSRAEFKEAAGTQYRIYTWKELLGD